MQITNYITMFRSLFKMMTMGANEPYIKTVRTMEKDGMEIMEIYSKLNDFFDQDEYRLRLWLPLSLD